MSTWLLFNIHLINFWYAVAGLFMLGVTLVLAFDYFCNSHKLYRQFLAQYVWGIIMLVTIGGVATTLLYSEILGFVPCSLCWLQRAALYPQVFLVLTACRLKDIKYFPVYGIILSIFGLMVAIYQYIYQALPQEFHNSGLMPCLADGSNADCAVKVMNVFGFITFPFLSAVTFAFLIIMYLYILKLGKE